MTLRTPSQPRRAAADNDYFVKVSAPPIATPTPVQTRSRMRSVTAFLVAFVVVATAAFVLTASRTPEMGSEEDLGAQIDALELPASMRQLDETYTKECPSPCPALVRWYDVAAPVETVRADIIARMTAADIKVNENSASQLLFAAANDQYIFFVVLDAEMIAGNVYAPAGTKAEISVHVLDRN
jgi:hypothetical protein